MSIVLTALCTLTIGFIVASMGEWLLHRYVMHLPLWVLRYPYERHARVHHITFRADNSYHLLSRTDNKKVAMAWWNWLILFPLGMIPFCAPAETFMYFDLWAETWTTYACGAVVVLGYYGTYEYLHWCMHVPKNRWVEKWSVFKWLKEHHRLHHRKHLQNMNVVLPLADLIFGTLLFQRRLSALA